MSGRLLQAARTGNVRRIEQALAAGESLEQVDDGRNTPLHIATGNLRNEALAALLAAGADPNTRNEDGETPLHFAARYQWAKGISTLVEAGAERDPADGRGQRPAELVRSVEAAEAILDAGLSPESLRSLVTVAAEKGSIGLTRRLLDAGATLAGSPSPLVVAAGAGALEWIEAFFGDLAPDSGPAHDASVAAVQGGFEEVVAWLLGCGVPPDGEGLALVEVTKGRHDLARKVRVAQLLLAGGADVNRARADGTTPLMVAAAQAGRGTDLLRLYLEHGADPNARDAKGQAVLEHAVFGGEKAIRLLLSFGADLEAPSSLDPKRSVGAYLRSLGIRLP